MVDLVQVEDRGAVRIVAINRPEVRNAISTGVLLQLRAAFAAAAWCWASAVRRRSCALR
mgnify:CR=1 FL=1